MVFSKSKKITFFRFLLMQTLKSIISAMKNGKPFKFGSVGKLFSRSIFLACRFLELGPESEIPAAENIVPEWTKFCWVDVKELRLFYQFCYSEFEMMIKDQRVVSSRIFLVEKASLTYRIVSLLALKISLSHILEH